jgi:hypothetical protein
VEYPKPNVPKKSRGNKLWERYRRRLKVIYAEKGIQKCELCGTTNFLSFAHRNKRRNTSVEELGSFYHTLLLCIPCHQRIEDDREETARAFALLRDDVRKITFEIVDKEGMVGIKCLICGLTSYNRNDIEQEYCGKCNKFHQFMAMENV